MNRYPKLGEEVEIIIPMPPSLKSDNIGIVEHRDGDYIDIRLNKSGVLVEKYPCELNEIKE